MRAIWAAERLPAATSATTIGRRNKESGDLQGSALPSDLPQIDLLTAIAPSGGQLYFANFPFDPTIATQPYLLEVNNSGVPRYSKRLTSRGIDFKTEPGNRYSYFDETVGGTYLLDSTYAIIDTFRCGNGYMADIHDFQMLPNGHVLVMAYDPQTVDMSAVVQGGNPKATVVGLIIQELDGDRNVVFQWRSWDHFQITDATHENLTAQTIDYVHGNAITLDSDGNLLISSRHLDEITKINRSTGDIIWRLGGKNNQFTFVNDSIGFSHQHDIRRIANGDITLFDNGNYHVPAFSRALEYKLDETAKTATLVWQFRHTPEVVSSAMGNVQRLANGHTVIGWGAANPTLTEVTPDGKVVYELTLPNGVFSYRAYRFPGPAATQVVLSSPEEGSLSLPKEIAFNWHFADSASSYRIQIATDSSFATPFTDATVSGTSTLIGGLKSDTRYYWRVRAQLASGTALWSDTWSFATIQDGVTLLQPSDAASSVDLVPTLAWQASAGAVAYQLELSTTPTFASMIVNDSAVTDTERTLERLDYGVTYYWRVRALHATDASNWSAVWSFTTLAPKQYLKLLTPSDGAIAVSWNPTLEWYPFQGATIYEVQMAKLDPQFGTLVIDDTVHDVTDHITNLDPGSLYYWRVRTLSEGMPGEWSETWYFQTGQIDPPAIPAVAQLLPPDGTMLTEVDSILFSWNGAGIADAHYHLEIASDQQFSSMLIDTTLSDTAAHLPRSLFTTGTYWWRVSLVDTNGGGPYSSPWSVSAPSSVAGIESQSTESEALLVSLAPNPAAETAALVIRTAEPTYLRATLIDVTGTIVMRITDEVNEAGEKRIALDLGSLPNGTYFCRVESRSGIVIRPIVVAH